MSDDYEVGYGKPPKHTQFKKGVCPNRKGRGKGVRNLKTELLEELAETVEIRENGRVRKVTKLRALVKRAVNDGIRGNDRAMNRTIDTYLKVGGLADAAAAADVPLTAEEQAVIDNLEARLERKIAAGKGKTKEKSEKEDES